ncbi:hypothetical protein HPP92_027140 [Vanilla planifolia]|uniref:CG-1 domain-containing protein n=1 Tax=Vanilla planifolia TaxID=51239 RepID=A0A835U5U1_VANPL|nr:hypothetical protein HPP92_027140 [Vanilla planifolia]
MADSRRLALTPQLDIEQILREAQNRWLRPLEICEILRNYGNFRIAPEPQNKPPSGSLFLFDRKVLRYFRKDGHNWRKKKDGKTVKEAHEKLKAGSVDVLHCYYAHGEDNENFQRRSYWMLEEELMHIVLVHYREVKGSKSSYIPHREDVDILRTTHPDSPASSNFSASLSQVPSQITDYGSPNSTQQSEYEDADSADNYQPSSRYHSFPEMQQHGPWMNVHHSEVGSPSLTRSDQFAQVGVNEVENPSDVDLTYSGNKTVSNLASWGNFLESYTTGFQTPSLDISVSPTWAATSEGYPQRNSLMLQDIFSGDTNAGEDGMVLLQNSVWQLSETDSLVNNNGVTNQVTQENLMYQLSDLTHEESGLKKYDSFSRWMSKELGEVDGSQITSSSTTYWSPLESETVVVDSSLLSHEQADNYLMGPSLSQDQLFSIIDFTPNWAIIDEDTEIVVKGRFLMSEEDSHKYKWSCMFGEIEVPAYIVADGTLCCRSPAHKSGRVPFYVTCSNRLACSEVREFEFKVGNLEISDSSYTMVTNLQIRLEKLLSLDSYDQANPVCGHVKERYDVDCSICSLIAEVDKEFTSLFKHTPAPDDDLSEIAPSSWFFEEQLKHKLHVWLLHKAGEEGKGPNVLDKEGQGVLHLSAALGYDWAIKPIVASGVNINFRDVHGWTAVHWAAFCGRFSFTEWTQRHCWISCRILLNNHLRTLTLKDPESTHLSESSGLLGFENVLDNINPYLPEGEIQASLSVVRNATEAAARIYQASKLGQQNDMPAHAAAIKIQNKFRGWKGRKEFLITRQRIVKIQAHVRGHQVRKQYKKIIWSVGIVEKVILRWRRKGSGLRGFRSEGLLEGQKSRNQPTKEDDYDFLQVGRKQTEARLEKALARVKSMVQYPEARDQYRRLITVVTELQASKLMQGETQSEMEEPSDTDIVMQIEGLLGDDDIVPTL